MNIKGKKLSIASIIAIVAAALALCYEAIYLFNWSYATILDFTGYRVFGEVGDFSSLIATDILYMLINTFKLFASTALEAIIVIGAFALLAYHLALESLEKKNAWAFPSALILYVAYFANSIFSSYTSLYGVWLTYYEKVTYGDVAYELMDGCYLLGAVIGLAGCGVLLLYHFGVFKNKIFPVASVSAILGANVIFVLVAFYRTVSYVVDIIKYGFGDDVIFDIYYSLEFIGFLAMLLFFAGAITLFTFMLIGYIKALKAEKDEAKKANLESMTVINENVDSDAENEAEDSEEAEEAEKLEEPEEEIEDSEEAEEAEEAEEEIEEEIEDSEEAVEATEEE